MRRTIISFLLILNVLFAAWQNHGGPWRTKWVTDIGVGMNSNQEVYIYLVNQDTILAKSTDEGLSWTFCRAGHSAINLVKCVAVEPTNPTTVYEGVPGNTIDAGIRKSYDGGMNWTAVNINLPSPLDPSRLIMFPDDYQTLLLGTGRTQGGNQSLFKTTNGGSLWRNVTPVANTFSVTDFCLHPLLTNFVYFSTDWSSDLPQAWRGIWRSEDRGSHWDHIGKPGNPGEPYVLEYPEILCVAVGSNGYIYAGYGPVQSGRTFGGIERSTDGGVHWQNLSLTLQQLSVTDIVVDPNDPSIIYASVGTLFYPYDGQGVLKSTDYGVSWQGFNNEMGDKFVFSLKMSNNNPSGTWNLYAGTLLNFYKLIISGPIYFWEDRIKNMYISETKFTEPRLPNFWTFSDCALYKSPDACHSWKMIASFPFPSDEGVVSPATNQIMLRSTNVLFPNIPFYYETWICRSTDQGATWSKVWSSSNENNITCIEFDPSFPGANVYANRNFYPPYFCQLKSIDAGQNWFDISSPRMIASFAIDKNNSNHLYAGNDRFSWSEVYESNDGGSSWHWKSNGIDYTWSGIPFLEFSNIDNLTLYAGTEHGSADFYRTLNAGEYWQKMGTLSECNLSAATLDPEEPTILYAGVQKSLTLDYKVYLSVDAGRQWIDISEGLPYSSTYSLTIDFNHPDTTYAATDSGLYYYVPPFNKSLVSSSDTATSYNNSRKMVRVENTDEIWITYESGEVIYAVQSLNAGGSWSRKMEIGEGCHPAIALYPCGDPPIWLPCITWRGTDGISLYFSRYDGMNWSAPTLVYQSTSPIGPPGFTVSTLPLIPPMGHIAFNTSETPENRVLYGFFSIFNPGLIDPQTLYIGENMSLVSIDYTSSLNQIHVVFDYDSWIVTRYSTDGGQSWSMPEWVSQVDNNHYPSIEAGGSAVYFFWQGTGPNNQPDIYCRHRYWDGANWWWSEVMRVNYSDGASKYPTSAGGFSCCWSEYTGSNWEIFLSRYDPMTGQWRPPVNISSSTGRSMFSHLNLQQDMTGIIRYFITYTERDQAPYDIAFKTYIPPSEPDQPFYAGDVGQENPGPFNLKRSGYISYGKESYKTIDYDTDFLYYRMGKFNPKKFYKIEGVFYHENEQSCDLVVEIDGKGIGRITVPPKTIKRLKALNPLELYQDSVIYVKAKCPDGNSVLSLLIAYEYEKTKVSVGGGSGTQSVENSLLIPKDFVISNSPNPFRNLTTIRYQLPLNCQVSFEVYDVCGKLIKRLIEGERKAGYYSLVWNGKNEKGKPLASGIYFCKIRAGKFNQTKKLLLLR